MVRALMLRIALGTALILAGCAPAIGDNCGSSVDCSVNGDRICDLASPGGYCTVVGCDPDTCPDGALCVEWRFAPDRTAQTYCMKRCGGDGDCRGSYACMRPEDPRLDEDYPMNDPASPMPLAQIVDLDESRQAASFCAADPDDF